MTSSCPACRNKEHGTDGAVVPLLSSGAYHIQSSMIDCQKWGDDDDAAIVEQDERTPPTAEFSYRRVP